MRSNTNNAVGLVLVDVLGDDVVLGLLEEGVVLLLIGLVDLLNLLELVLVTAVLRGGCNEKAEDDCKAAVTDQKTSHPRRTFDARREEEEEDNAVITITDSHYSIVVARSL
jgi:hypothetical protein